MKSIISDDSIPWHDLDGKTILVTGATGLIGSNIINTLLYYGEKTDSPSHILAVVRNKEKADRLFSEQLDEHRGNLSFVIGDVCEPIQISGPIDYIIHAASETASKSFVAYPVEIIRTSIAGTWNMLELAREKNVKAFLYLSSMEAYGSPHGDTPLAEDSPAYFSSTSVRNCYPESKRMCEMLASSFAAEYDVPAKLIRLAQTFGPGVAKDDLRVFAYFARQAVVGEDIVLATKGESKRMYLYTADAVRAIFAVLLKGKAGQCYNAANPVTYCSILEMAKLVSQLFSNAKTKIVFSEDPHNATKYPLAHDLNLDINKLESLGWHPSVSLSDMYIRMVAEMEIDI